MLSVNFLKIEDSKSLIRNWKNAMTKRKDNTTIDTQNITATAKD
jgi:hypothetical protein